MKNRKISSVLAIVLAVTFALSFQSAFAAEFPVSEPEMAAENPAGEWEDAAVGGIEVQDLTAEEGTEEFPEEISGQDTDAVPDEIEAAEEPVILEEPAVLEETASEEEPGVSQETEVSEETEISEEPETAAETEDIPETSASEETEETPETSASEETEETPETSVSEETGIQEETDTSKEPEASEESEDAQEETVIQETTPEASEESEESEESETEENPEEDDLTIEASDKDLPCAKITEISFNGKGIVLKWDAVADASGYFVCRRVKDGEWEQIKDLTSLSFTDKSADCGITYEYLVQGYRLVDGIKKAGKPDEKKAKTCIRAAQAENLKAAGNEEGIALSWDSAPGADTYLIYYKTEISGKWKKLDNTSDCFYTHMDAAYGTVYYYTVRAGNSYGQSSFDTEGISCVNLPAVTITSVAYGKNKIQLSWKKAEGAEGYRVYRRQKGSGSWKKVKDVSGTSLKLKQKTSGTTYEYQIVPYVVSSGSKMLGTRDDKTIKTVTWLSLPVMKAVSPSVSGMKVTWKKTQGAQKYYVYRREEGGKWKKIAVSPDTRYIDTTMKNGVVYSYRAVAVCSTGRSTVQGEGLSNVYLPGMKIAKAVNTVIGIRITWPSMEGAGGYRIYRRIKGQTKWVGLKDTEDIGFIDTSAKVGTTYQYCIRAYTDIGGKRYFGVTNVNGAITRACKKAKAKDLSGASLKKGGVYFIQAALNSRVLRVADASTFPGQNVTLYTNNGYSSQRWVLQASSVKGYYTIRNIRSWKVLEVESDSSSKVNVAQAEYTGSNSQLWTFVPTGDGKSCYVVNRDGQCLIAASEKDEDGVNIRVGNRSLTSREKFIFTGSGQGDGVDYSQDGEYTVGLRTFRVSGGNVEETDDYYNLRTDITIPGGGYSLSTSNIGLKVIYVNRYLANHGYLSSDYSTYERFNASTAAAVRSFQSNNGLTADGIVGPETWQAMGYSLYDWYYLGTYVTPLHVDRYAADRDSYVQAMIDTAEEYRTAGTGYRVGSSGAPGSYVDCSGLIYQCLYAAGVNPYTNIVDHAYADYEYTSRYLAADARLGISIGSTASALPGDLFFYAANGGTRVDHVALYAGGGMIYDSWPGLGVTYRSSSISGYYVVKIIRPF